MVPAMSSRPPGPAVLRAADRLLADLRNAPGGARLVAELGAAAAGHGVATGEVEAALGYLAGAGRIAVADHPAPDPHLAGLDLRIAAVIEGTAAADAEGARRRMEERWRRFVREFLASHRCG